MRQRTTIIIGLTIFVALCLSLFFIRLYVNKVENEYKERYKSIEDVYKQQIEQIGSKKEIESLFKDSIPLWRQKDKEMLAEHLEELQFYIDEYNDILTMPKEKVDKVYRSALEELVRKYRNDELKPTE